MRLRTLIMMVALATSWPVNADIMTRVAAVETIAANLRLPVSDNGRLSFRPCDERCDADFVMVRLTPATEFVVSGSRVEYLDFRKAFFNLKPGSETYTLVQYDTNDSTATSVQIGF